jgi:NTP pyrophosphatase (non-canonical NTP hydrolase)
MINSTINDLLNRMEAAEAKYGPPTSTHESMGVALEEWHELIEAVRSNKLGAVYAEALDLAAVLIRMAEACETEGPFWQRSGFNAA